MFYFTFIHLGFCPKWFFCELLPEKWDHSELVLDKISEVFCPASLSPSTIAGIASSILLFVAAIATMVCCFMCSCCYLYQRRQQRGRTPYEGKCNYFILFTVHPEFTTNIYEWIQNKREGSGCRHALAFSDLHSQTCTLRHLHFHKWRHLQSFLFYFIY